jgi:DNA invertase Pin-like site-specific DNA recombinase
MSSSKKRSSKDIDTLTNELNTCSINTNKINRTFILARVSSKSQVDSLPVQIQACTNYCTKNNISNITVVEDICSAFNNYDKLKLHTLLNKHHNINLVIKDPSRLARHIVDGSEIIKICNDKNILIHVADYDFRCDTTVNTKRLLCGVYDAEIEAKTLSKRQKTHNDTKRKLGSHFGPAPFGMEVFTELTNNIKLRKLRDLMNEHVEKKTIKLISMMYGGMNLSMMEFYELFNSLHSNELKLGSTYKFTDIKNKEYTASDLKKGFHYNSIVNILNDWKILNRGKEWSTNTLKNVIAMYIDASIFTYVELEASDSDYESSDDEFII